MELLLLWYLQWEPRELDFLIKELVERLENIRVVLVRRKEGKPELVLERMSREGAQLFTRLNLGRFIPGPR